jgi:hypothetical protein
MLFRALEIRKRILGNEHPLTMKAYLSMASLMCVEQRDYKQAFEYARTVYLVRLRLFPADAKEIREVESTVFEYALLLLLAYARAGENPSVVKKVALWTIDAAQSGLVACCKKPAAQRAASAARGESSAVTLERGTRGEGRTKELQVHACRMRARDSWGRRRHARSHAASGAREDTCAASAAHLPPLSRGCSVAALRFRREGARQEVFGRDERGRKVNP